MVSSGTDTDVQRPVIVTRIPTLSTLRQRHEDFAAAGLDLDLTRGKPSPEQLALSDRLSGILGDDFTAANGTDVRNYGGRVTAAAELGSWLLDVPASMVHPGGNASLELMWHTVALHHLFGVDGTQSAWRHRTAPKVICPVPGYDRHFTLTERLGLGMVTVPMVVDGPDMDVVEHLVGTDPDIVAMWNVPKYSNPTGVVYSDEVVDRIAALPAIAGPHFRVLWDNAYAVHDLTDDPSRLASILAATRRHDTVENVIQFASTSKITWAGSGVAFVAATESNHAALAQHMSSVTIGPDKANQQRHVRLLADRATLADHMAQHATLLRPRFAIVQDVLDNTLGDDGRFGTWTRPEGGYFVSFWSRPGLASRIVALAGAAGVTLTPAGAAFPHGHDPTDSHIRLAPSNPAVADLQHAMEVFAACVQHATLEAEQDGEITS